MKTRVNHPIKCYPHSLSCCVLFMSMLLLFGCGGGGGGSSPVASEPVTPPPVVVPPVVVPPVEEPPAIYSVQGDVFDETQTPVAGALISVAGIQASSLSDQTGHFKVQSDVEFDNDVVVTIAKDGYESFSQTLSLLTGDGDNAYQLEQNIALAAIDPWGFLEINVVSVGNSLGNIVDRTFDNPTFGRMAVNAMEGACDCVVSIEGRASKDGEDKSELYILLVVDTSGSTDANMVGDKRVFDIEIESLTALVDNLTASDTTYVGVIKFATQAEVVMEFSTDLTGVKTALAGITAQTSGTSGAATNYQAALELVRTTFGNVNLDNRDIKTVAFLSDGIPTAPFGSGTTQEPSDRLSAIEAAANVASDGITINTFPVNIDSQLTTLPTVSAITNGIYYQHDSTEVVEKLPNDNLVGLVGIEIVNQTTAEQALDLVLRPDGLFSGNVCLTAEQDNDIKITPAVCDSCEKVAYQTIKVSCEKEECSSCAGQVTNLQLQYSGGLADAEIEVLQRKNANQSDTLFAGVVQLGDSFEFYGASRDKTMGSSIQIMVNGQLNAEFVTSCGQPRIGPGRTNGDFEVLKGYSRNGGLLCPI